MKKFLIALMIAAGIPVCSLKAQENNIPVKVIFSDNNLPEQTSDYIANKLHQITIANGIGGSSASTNFAITARVNLINKEVLAGPPQKVALTINCSLYIADTYEEKIYSFVSMELKSVGSGEIKAYQEAIRQINPNSKLIQDFATRGKQKIIDYFNQNYKLIIKKSDAFAAVKKYQEAIFHVMSIPECCNGYEEALNAAVGYYKMYVNNEGQKNLAKARAIWVAHQNSKGAEAAGEYLKNIYPDAECYPDAMKLYEEMKLKVGEEISFIMKMYDNSVDIEKQRIDAMKEIGVAFGEHQQPTSLNWIK